MLADAVSGFLLARSAPACDCRRTRPMVRQFFIRLAAPSGDRVYRRLPRPANAMGPCRLSAAPGSRSTPSWKRNPTVLCKARGKDYRNAKSANGLVTERATVRERPGHRAATEISRPSQSVHPRQFARSASRSERFRNCLSWPESLCNALSRSCLCRAVCPGAPRRCALGPARREARGASAANRPRDSR